MDEGLQTSEQKEANKWVVVKHLRELLNREMLGFSLGELLCIIFLFGAAEIEAASLTEDRQILGDFAPCSDDGKFMMIVVLCLDKSDHSLQ